MKQDGKRYNDKSNASHCFRRFFSLVGVVTLDSNLRIRNIRANIRKLIFELKIEFSQYKT